MVHFLKEISGATDECNRAHEHSKKKHEERFICRLSTDYIYTFIYTYIQGE